MKKSIPDSMQMEANELQMNPVSTEKSAALFQLWALRMLVKQGGHKRFIDMYSWNNEELATFLGLPMPPQTRSDAPRKAFAKDALTQLNQLHAQAEQSAKKSPPHPSEALASNSQRLARHLGLTEIDQEILAFVVALHTESMLEATAECMGDLNSSKVYACIGAILDRDPNDIRTALSKKGKLCSTGIITVCHNIRADLKTMLDILSGEFSDRMMASAQDPIDLIRDTVRPSKPANLAMADYAHIGKNLNLLRHYLDEALNQNRAGVNILVYGPPGTGKSELARLITETCNASLYEVASEDGDGDPVDGATRLRSYRAAMSFFAQHRAVVLFDEAEDIFNDGGLFNRSTAEKRKAWLNRMLEESAVPTIWLSNDGESIDPAFIRRYDMTFRLDIAPPRRRKEMLRQLTSEYLNEADVSMASQSENLAPAVISRATNVLSLIKDRLPEAEWSSSLLHLMNNTLETQGHSRIKKKPGQIPTYYDPAFINANANLDDLPDGLRQVPSARICLYGPPGTGKTAYGYWLADRLEQHLLVKRASDLMSMWVGKTEKNIAAAFQEAENEGAILLIDEVESFLSDRRKAQHNWETSAVNELLTQMESFSGIFVASTNLMEGLDQAAYRRFDVKLKFDYLRPEQAWALLCSQCKALNIDSPNEPEKRRLHDLKLLTPGDYAVVARRHQLTRFKSASEMIDQLRLEVALKEDARTNRPIGFIS